MSIIAKNVLGINNCFAVKRWPEPHEWARLIGEELSLSAVQFSLDLVDLAMPEKLLVQKAADIRQACADANLKIHSVFTGLNAYQSNLLMAPDPTERRYWLDWYKKAAIFSAELECDRLGGHLGALTCADYSNLQRKEMILNDFFEAVNVLSEFSQKQGITALLLECMPVYREMTATVAGAKEFQQQMQEVSCLPIEICLDTGHQCAWDNRGDERSVYHWFRELGERVTMIHLQQNNGVHDQHMPFTPETQGSGIIHGKEFFDLIEIAEGPALFLEIIPAHEASDQRVLEELILSAQYWRNAAGKA